MLETVYASQAETKEKAMAGIADLFSKGRYDEVARVIGMHSIMVDPQHTMADQAALYRSVLDMIKNRIRTAKGPEYAAWMVAFPRILREVSASGQVVTDAASAAVIGSHLDAYGTFSSVDDFFRWALDDRRLSLGQIVKYIEKTAELFKR